MIVHEMRLHPGPFGKIKEGSQVIESRINDEKRQGFRVGDHITFKLRPEEVETVEAEITEFIHVPTFRELFAMRPLAEFGVDDLEQKVEEMREYYSPEEEAKHGVVGIKFKKV